MQQLTTFVPRFLAVAAAAGALIACGGDGGDTAGGQAVGGEPVVVENAATLTGRVAFNGAPPAAQPIDMRDEPTCAENFDGENPHSQPVSVSDGHLKNVFIHVTEGLSGNYPASGDPVIIDQVDCVYIPRVVGVQVGQNITFRNSDGLLHNIRATPSVNRGFNISQPTNMDTQRSFSSREVMVPIECNVHGWMDAFIGVVDHPYFAVSGEDGSFRIENLPPGTYTIETWHERYGTQTQQVTLAANETKDISFAYDATMAGRPVPLGAPLDPHAHPPVAGGTSHAHGTGR